MFDWPMSGGIGTDSLNQEALHRLRQHYTDHPGMRIAKHPDIETYSVAPTRRARRDSPPLASKSTRHRSCISSISYWYLLPTRI